MAAPILCNHIDARFDQFAKELTLCLIELGLPQGIWGFKVLLNPQDIFLTHPPWVVLPKFGHSRLRSGFDGFFRMWKTRLSWLLSNQSDYIRPFPKWNSTLGGLLRLLHWADSLKIQHVHRVIYCWCNTGVFFEESSVFIAIENILIFMTLWQPIQPSQRVTSNIRIAKMWNITQRIFWSKKMCQSRSEGLYFLF